MKGLLTLAVCLLTLALTVSVACADGEKEAAMLSLLGGAIGLTLAWVAAWGISQIDLGGFSINAVVSPLIVTVAVSLSVMIGLGSGIYPAWRAARLNPIDALRYG